MSDNLHTFIDPELQARIAALVLGEASEFERDELEKLIAEKPELEIYRRRIQSMHDLLGDTIKSDPDPEWQLSADKRKKLHQTFAQKGAQITSCRGRELKGTTRVQIRAAVSIAACILITVVLFFMATPVVLKQFKRSSEEHAASYQVAYEDEGYGLRGGLDLDEEMLNDDGVVWAAENGERKMKVSKVKKKPLAPSSSLSKAIASNTTAPAAVPVPKVNAPDPSADFGSGDDYGDGWGKGDKKGRGRRASGGGGGGGDLAEADPFAVAPESNKAVGNRIVAGKKESIDRVIRRELEAKLSKDVDKLSEKNNKDFVLRVKGNITSSEGATGVDAIIEQQAGDVLDVSGRQIASNGDVQLGLKAEQSKSRYAWSAERFLKRSSGPASGEEGKDLSANERDDNSFLTGRTDEDLVPSSHGQLSDMPAQQPTGVTRPEGSALKWKADQSMGYDDNLDADKEVKDRIANGRLQVTPATPADVKSRNTEEVRYSIDDSEQSERGISSIAKKEIARRSALVAEADEAFLEGRDAYANKNYKKAAEYYKKAGTLLPPGEATAGRRDGVRNHLGDANLYHAQQLRETGKYAEARQTLEKTLRDDPDNFAAKKQLEYLNDPIRTTPGLSFEYTQKVNEVRKNLYIGEGYYNLGQYDKAEAEMKKVLQKDPYNKAARRWLEKVYETNSDYYRAAYDQTRAELLMEVDRAWEIAGAPQVKEDGLKRDLATLVEERPKPVAKNGTVDTPARPKPLPDETLTSAEPFSTFSLNVNDVSFKLARVALLEKGKWPDAAKVRTEEFVNAFDYGDPSPRRGEPVACAIEQSAHPFLQQRNLLRVGMKTAAMGRSQPLRLTVLLDNSGSMEREDREASVLAAMQVLAAQLNPQDVITVVSFARQPRLIADRIPGHQAAKLVDLVAKTPSEGGTNIEEALKLARTLAKRQHAEGAQSRVVLITDGVANLGNTIPEQLSKEVETMRQQGIAFDACGVGAEGLNDDILESLTRKGDGRYYFLNRPEDADDGFAKQLAGAFTPAAKNVKVQVVFNPKRVARYRLLGFEKHRLKKEDFRNDKVDAAEMAAEEAGNAVYQIQVNPQGDGELGEVFVRFLDASTGRMVERSWPLPYESKAKPFDLAAPSMQLAGTASMLGEKLHGTDAGSVRFSMISDTLGKLSAHYASDTKVQDLIRMCRKEK